MNKITSIQEFQSKIKRVLITKEEIDAAIVKAGKEIDKIYDGRPILLVSILKGAFVFMQADASLHVCRPLVEFQAFLTRVFAL